MNFKDLLRPRPVTKTCPLGSGFQLTWDANKFTGECFRRMGRTYKARAEQVSAAQGDRQAANSLAEAVAQYEQTMEVTAITADVSVEIYADVLAPERYGIIMDWVLDDGTPPTFENLMQLEAEALKFIFDFCRDNSGPKEQGTPTKTPLSLTTSETTSAGSSGQTTLSPESPTM